MTLTRGRTLAWTEVRGATYYNVILWQGSERLLDLFTPKASVRLPARWTYRGSGRRLKPGEYLWFVYPGFGRPEQARFGQLADSGIFEISS